MPEDQGLGHARPHRDLTRAHLLVSSLVEQFPRGPQDERTDRAELRREEGSRGIRHPSIMAHSQSR